jgi:hypothetical protein
MAAGVINAKSFMEFFERENGIIFIDTTTGEKALDIIRAQEEQKSKKQICCNCEYAVKGDGKFAHIQDLICANGNSPNVSDFMTAKTTCNYWEQRKENDADGGDCE